MSQPVLQFEEALDILQGMFSEWSRPALSQMLQANQLNMELTIESILSIGAPPPGFGVSSEPPDVGASSSPVPPPDVPSSSSRGAADDGRRGAKVTLPDDFLRVPGQGSSASQQMLVDEQLAIMLQDEMFLRELRRMPEFDPYTRRRTPRSGGGQQQQAGPSPSSGPGRPRVSSGDVDSLASLRKNLGDMGAEAKRRLGDVYTRFIKSREGGRDQSHVPLMDDGGDDESEVVFFSNSSDTTRRRGGSSSSTNPMIRNQDIELSAVRSTNRPAATDYQDEEEILIQTGGIRASPSDTKKLL